MRSRETLCKIFDVRIGVRPGELRVEVLDSPAGQRPAVPFRSPIGEEEVERLERCFAGSRGAEAEARGVRRHLRPLASAGDGEGEPWERVIGRRLFEALLPGTLRDAWDESFLRVEHGGDHARRRLLLRLRFDLEAAGAEVETAALHRLPWELLFDPRRRKFLAQWGRFSLGRYPEVAKPDGPGPTPGPLRVLVVPSAPTGDGAPARLDLDREAEGLRGAAALTTGSSWEIDVRFVPRATLREIRDELHREPVHVLHFMGHGDFDRVTGAGALVLEDDAGGPAPVSAACLVEEIGLALSSVRLVVLNACRTAEAGVAAPYAGVATALVAQGVGAVIAMRHPISDDGAVAFSGALYDRLARGEAVDEAVSAGRRAIHVRDEGRAEWATPALFLRAAPEPLVGGDAPGPALEAGRRVRLALGGAALAASLAFALWTGLHRPFSEPGRFGSDAPDVESGTAAAAAEPANEIRRIRFDEPTDMTEIEAVVTVAVAPIEGAEMIRLTVAPEGGKSVSAVLFPGDSTSVPAPGGTIEIQVLALHRQQRELSLRAFRKRGPSEP